MEEITDKSIIRARYAGVFFGTIIRKEGDEVTIKDCRRLWYWDGAASLSELATKGVTKPESCKFCVTVPAITVMGVIEIIPCTQKAINNINAVPVWRMSK